ncbi:hypothetical protein TWF569_009424 [Orbilia oligospora]|nr:hypothetical protein TWF103_011135 [Orbilia oligospora]KAF3114002.1 hypothetical protein TWF706_009350 [Orbilia oligospora]KAF3136427.1 hypothetical protein TWF569_009424 [Orbilia oligospora]
MYSEDKDRTGTCEDEPIRRQSPRLSLRSASSNTENKEDHSYDEDRSTGVREANRRVIYPTSEVEGEFWAPVCSDSVAASIWNAKVEVVIRVLDRRAFQWTALHLGVVNTCNTVAVIYEGDGPWGTNEIITELRDLLPADIFSHIKFLESRVAKGAALDSTDYVELTECGACIGIAGVWWSAGTVGGYLTTDNEEEVYGITCHHALLPTKTNANPKDTVKSAIEYPNFLDNVDAIHGAISPGALKLKVVQPPCGYHGDTISSLQSRKEEAESRLKVVENKYEILSEPTPAASSIKLWSSCIMDVEKRLSHISQFVRDFGEAVATSGYRVHPGAENSLDWGIFRIMTEFGREGVWKSLRSAPCLHPDTSDPVLGEEAAKIGMKTGLTFGRINGVKDLVNFKENRRPTK